MFGMDILVWQTMQFRLRTQTGVWQAAQLAILVEHCAFLASGP
jgi:hypothetical protein